MGAMCGHCPSCAICNGLCGAGIIANAPILCFRFYGAVASHPCLQFFSLCAPQLEAHDMLSISLGCSVFKRFTENCEVPERSRHRFVHGAWVPSEGYLNRSGGKEKSRGRG